MNINENASIESILKAIGDNLMLKAKQAGLKKKDLAALAAVNQNTITAISAGGDLRVSTLIRLTRVLGDSSWLLPLIEEPAPTPLQQLQVSVQKMNTSTASKKPEARRIGRQFSE